MLTDADVERWLREDVGHHDVTNDVPGETSGRLVAKESGVAAGVDAASAVFDYLDATVTERVADGTAVEPGDALLRVAGPAQAVLRGERVAVNVAAHASGVATRTDAAVAAAREVDDDVRVAATRKTTPGLRGVEKRAVAAAGGDTHRLDLSHMVMVKDNHVAELGLTEAIERFRERASFATGVEVEVEGPDAAARAAAVGADVVLLDNMAPSETTAAAERVAAADGDALTEASGGITVETVPDYAATGVDVISMGGLTHSAPALDLSFRTGSDG
ncbi:carboxylating nicotinate-nucleotide diphosphorylase [Halorubrum ezzemoulense]|uniref:Nicotinate-nucleotide pyrophosphorylase [carboxylating] n=1 Tax=Halorubrum ezzemoulense TaxID=337243 RepID=A0A256KBU5_HALEZ|nr:MULTISPECIES: carboxylating nicotinate-nucleotide diphosphorylase [Halorubrum]MDB9248349.1 carboxylating nicotinate-nucleotide diphosphorylase [Halorubrum ezzemoulense]MDB9259313.1 carboxylating nicotinate-nucleotide diphosphorylase [Halorubrum ezzemoulense]MDB9262108.1 carboxylating nicotinate-nucleotide diphosphorylase [Halorubrum ezzemoulense]MDB9266332.1 carboxylating nicotinate-nucleotide diphosphorylase [Halorubrum ezzemoulense]MDB9269674.1 carboxylating nicotinate-nucleotide diphosph